MINTKFTTFIGVDQSLTSTGYYIGPRSKGLIKPGSKLRGSKRLLYISKKFTDILDKQLQRCKSSEILVCMEGYAYNYRVGKVFELGEVGGIIKLACASEGIACVSVPPGELKKFVTGKSTASKELMMKTLKEKQNDIADAHGLHDIAKSMYGYLCFLEDKPTPRGYGNLARKQLEVLCNCVRNSDLR